jgi:TonB family protein
MSAAAALAPKVSDSRRFARLPISVALDVIALRSGVPENLPGRCIDLSEGGVGAMVAGEVAAGQQVALELRLPDVGLPLRARALVRYQNRLRCGFEFVALPTEQQEMIRYWAHRGPSQLQETPRKEDAAITQSTVTAHATVSRPRLLLRLRGLYLLLAGMLLLGAVGWWQWQRSWNELETGVYAAQDMPLRVPAETMEKRIISKADPVYPERAREAGRQGLAVLDAIIGEDGSVEHVHVISGDPVLVKAATDAVRLWKFEPYQFSGRPVRVETTIAVEFQLN